MSRPRLPPHGGHTNTPRYKAGTGQLIQMNRRGSRLVRFANSALSAKRRDEESLTSAMRSEATSKLDDAPLFGTRRGSLMTRPYLGDRVGIPNKLNAACSRASSASRRCGTPVRPALPSRSLRSSPNGAHHLEQVRLPITQNRFTSV